MKITPEENDYLQSSVGAVQRAEIAFAAFRDHLFAKYDLPPNAAILRDGSVKVEDPTPESPEAPAPNVHPLPGRHASS